MATYNTVTKIIIGSPMETDASTGMKLGTQDSTDDPSLAKVINDYWQGLDDSSGEILSQTAVALTSTVIAVIITHKG